MARPFLCPTMSEYDMTIKSIPMNAREIFWYPEWTRYAECAKYPIEFVDSIFFESGNNGRKIRIAKNICAACPVIHKCREANRYVPLGIFFGMTALERWRWNGFKGYPNSNKISFRIAMQGMA